MKKAERSSVGLALVLFFFIPAILFAGQIPDTGQATCSDDAGNIISCPQPGEAFYGQDANYTINPMSFTKLDIFGNDLPDNAVLWAMVRDNVTGLIWEVKQDKDDAPNYANHHDADNIYTWYDSNPERNDGDAGTKGDGVTTFDTEQFINALNAANYGGYHDWRMPSKNELEGIVNYNNPYPGPSINTVYFPNTNKSEASFEGYYWSATNQAIYSNVWLINFLAGNTVSNDKNFTYHARAVRGEQTMSVDNLVNNGDGTVTNKDTGLMWQQESPDDTMTWEQSLSYCESLNLSGYDDWRMPNIKELRSLADYSRCDPAINTTYFPENFSLPLSEDYWSSTTYTWDTNHSGAYTAEDTIYAFCLNFYAGYDEAGYKGYEAHYEAHVRAVRGGQSGSFEHLAILSPKQASLWDIGSLMSICWQTEGLGTNVKISLSRLGGWDDSFETIIESTPNDGQYDWSVTSPTAVNCVIKIEQVDNSANWATEGLFVIQCAYTISPVSKTFDSLGGTGIVSVDASEVACDWRSISNVFWITILSGGSGNSDGAVIYEVAPNFGGVSRSGTLTVAGKNFTVTQEGTPIPLIPLGKIPDTGQTKCYDADGNEILCPAPGENFYGQDANYTINPMSYTKLDENGNDLPDYYITWTMVRDNVTGLIWECKQYQGGVPNYANPHDGDNTYKWYDPNPATNGGDPGTQGDGVTTFDTEQFINALNTSNYGGHNDWRIPTVNELASITSYGIPDPGPAINAAYFKNTDAAWWWTATPYASMTNSAWLVDFNSGYAYYDLKSSGRSVRAVRGEQSGSMDYFVSNGDGTVTDTDTGLMWQQDTTDNTMTWEQSLSNCENLSLAGYMDWRLPSAKELQSIVDYSRYNPAIDISIFPDTLASSYWSSTTSTSDTSKAWGAFFYSGYGSRASKGNNRYVRAVRSGQSGSLDHFVFLSPKKASTWKMGSVMPIRWNPQGLGTNVKISMSRAGGMDSSFETIIETTANDGQEDWTVTGAGSINCVIKIEQSDNPDNWATEGFFVIGCTYTISPVSKTFDSLGGTGIVSVDASREACHWTAVVDAPADTWITITSDTSGVGDGEVEYVVSANSTFDPRNGTITIAGITITITQDAMGCSYTIIPESETFTAENSSGSLTVIASHDICIWTAASNVEWLTLTGGVSGTGDGTVNFSLSANIGWARSGTITIAGETFTVRQDAGTNSFGKIPDTGQIDCYNSSEVITCPAPDQPFYGQDSSYTINPVSYTKLDANGNELPYDSMSWVMVRDNVTSLIWESKQNKDSVRNYDDPHDADNIYTWYDSNPVTNGGNAGIPGEGRDTEDFINALNSNNYGGYHDWRLPTSKELGYIINYGIPYPGPTINTSYFPGTAASWYWSATTYTSDTGNAWGVYFYNGSNDRCAKSSFRFVRAVRGKQSVSSDQLVINGNGTVTDTNSGLMWQQDTYDNVMTWQNALATCENSTLAGQTDWRLPTIKELQSLVDYSCYNPSISTSYFLDTSTSFYLSSTKRAGYPVYHWVVEFYSGSYKLYTNAPYYVRAVRGGQSGSLGHLVIFGPNQASSWYIDGTMPIRWDTAGLGTNVKISLSRQGGLAGTFTPIITSVPNDGQYDWTIDGAASVNCVIKIEQADDPDNWATEGLFVITIQKGDVNGDGQVGLADTILCLQILTGLVPDSIYPSADVNGDGKIGMEEAIYVLEKITDLR